MRCTRRDGATSRPPVSAPRSDGHPVHSSSATGGQTIESHRKLRTRDGINIRPVASAGAAGKRVHTRARRDVPPHARMIGPTLSIFVMMN